MLYRKEIDGLRALAVMPVVFFHAGFESFSGGYVGVDIFLVISGYLITSIILKEQKEDSFTLLNFYERRIRRILPALFTVIFFSSIISYFLMTPSQLIDFAESVIASSLFISNLHFFQEAGYFSIASELKPLLHTWSLAIEEQFYFFYPLILLTLGYCRRKAIVYFLGLIFLISIVFCHFAAVFWPSANYYLIPTRAWELLLGCFAAFYLVKQVDLFPNYKVLKEILSILGGIFILASIVIFNGKTLFPSFLTLLPTSGALLIILFGSSNTLIGRFLGNRIFVSLGLISYSIYLWHQPLFAFTRIFLGDELDNGLYILLIFLSIFLAYLSWSFIENYFRNKERIKSKSIFISMTISISVFILFSLLAINSNGFKYRYEYINDQLVTTTEEFADYVSRSFDERQLTPFDKSLSKRKLLIIGDSYARDLANIVSESKLRSLYQISTHLIHADCGALLLKNYEKINQYIDKRCSLESSNLLPDGRFEDSKVINLLEDSDEIWIAHSYNHRDWLVDLLPESLENLKEITEAKITFFGHKDFGQIKFREILALSPERRKQTTFRLNKRYIDQNNKISEILDNNNYIDLTDFYCNQTSICKLFDENGYLISYDGSHLTKEGATYFGNSLYTNLGFE